MKLSSESHSGANVGEIGTYHVYLASGKWYIGHDNYDTYDCESVALGNGGELLPIGLASRPTRRLC